jgi:hypothetical protein
MEATVYGDADAEADGEADAESDGGAGGDADADADADPEADAEADVDADAMGAVRFAGATGAGSFEHAASAKRSPALAAIAHRSP